MSSSIIDRIKQALSLGKNAEMGSLCVEAMESGMTARQVLDDALVSGMAVVGERFRRREIFLPHVLLSARAMYAGLDVLTPHLEGDGAANGPVVVLGTVQGDLHDIGKNLVAIMLRGAGLKVVDLGSDVSPAAFVAAAREHSAAVVGLSALLTTTMPMMRQVVDGLREAGLGDVKVLVGGAPVSDEFAVEIGAHGYGYNAARAVELAKGYVQ